MCNDYTNPGDTPQSIYDKNDLKKMKQEANRLLTVLAKIADWDGVLAPDTDLRQIAREAYTEEDFRFHARYW